jgi:hypothetical protein
MAYLVPYRPPQEGFANKRSVCHVEIAPNPPAPLPPPPLHPCFATPPLHSAFPSFNQGWMPLDLLYLIYPLPTLLPQQMLSFQTYFLETEALLPTFLPRQKDLLPTFLRGNRSSPSKFPPWKKKLFYQPSTLETEALLQTFLPGKKDLLPTFLRGNRSSPSKFPPWKKNSSTNLPPWKQKLSFKTSSL